MAKNMELKMGLKVLHSVEGVLRALRSTGPFGGAGTSSLSLSSIIKKAEEQAELDHRSLKQDSEVPNRCTKLRVYFEDKYQKSKRTLVEEYITEILQIPDSTNGFEFLCHPFLDKAENLLKYFRAWHLSTLTSLFLVLENSTLSSYYLNPQNEEELEVANELRKRFNIALDSETCDIANNPDVGRPDKDLVVQLKTRHCIRKLLVKIKVSNLKDYKAILEGILLGQTPGSRTSSAIGRSRRNRFLSEHVSSDLHIGMNQSPSSPFPIMRMLSSNESSLDLSGSFVSSSEPFKLQDSLIKERAMHSKKLSSGGSKGDQSIGNMRRKGRRQLIPGSQTLMAANLVEEKMRYTLDVGPDDEMTTGHNDSHEAQYHQSPHQVSKLTFFSKYEVSQGKKSHRRSGVDLNLAGLASIGSALLRSGTIGDEELELDEDDRLMQICDSLDSARDTISTFHLDNQIASLLEVPHPGTAFTPTRLVLNLLDESRQKHPGSCTLGEWLDIAQQPGPPN